MADSPSLLDFILKSQAQRKLEQQRRMGAPIMNARTGKQVGGSVAGSRVDQLNSVINNRTGAHAASVGDKLRARELRRQELLRNL